MIMIQKLRLVGAVAVVSAIAFTAQAQTRSTAVPQPTNAVQSLTFALTAFYQGTPVSTVNHKITNVTENASSATIGTKDVIALLGAATGNTFSSSAQLLRVTPILDGTNGPATVIVRDTTSKTTNIVDVGAFFSTSSYGTTVTNTTGTNGVIITDTTYAVRKLSLSAPEGYTLTTHFDLYGFVVGTVERDLFKDGLITYAAGSTWTVTGTGERNGSPIVIDGNAGKSTFTVSDPKFVVGTGYSVVSQQD